MQVDEYPAPGQRMSGMRHSWRSDHVAPPSKYETPHYLPNTEVDEIVIDSWFHLEAMSDKDYWVSIGGIVINVRVGKDGKAKSVIVEHEGEDGVTYGGDYA